MDFHAKAAAYADRIEQELRGLGWWRESAMPDAAFDSQNAFFSDTMAYSEWLQFVLLDRIRDIAKNGGTFPRESNVGAQAVREFDGYVEARDLVVLLSEFDAFIEHRHPDTH